MSASWLTCWQFYYKGCPFLLVAIYTYLSPMGGDNTVGDGKPQPRTACLGGIKGEEYPLLLLRGDKRTCIVKPQRDLPGGLAPGGKTFSRGTGYSYPATLGGCFKGIENYVLKGPGKLFWPGQDRREVFG